MKLQWYRPTKGQEQWIAIKTWPTPASGQVLRVLAGFGNDNGKPRHISRLCRDRRFLSDRGLHNAVRCLNNRHGIQIPMPEFIYS